MTGVKTHPRESTMLAAPPSSTTTKGAQNSGWPRYSRPGSLGDFAGREQAVVLEVRLRRQGEDQGGFRGVLNVTGDQVVGSEAEHPAAGKIGLLDPGFRSSRAPAGGPRGGQTDRRGADTALNYPWKGFFRRDLGPGRRESAGVGGRAMFVN